MLNHEVPYNTSADVMGQVSSYFSIVENAVATGDTNKRYSVTSQTCYSPSPPVQARSFTTFLISPSSDNTADIYNGYINAEMEVTIKPDKSFASGTIDDTTTRTSTTYWFGFKNARDAINKYEICANGISVYTQSFAIEEGFITSCGITQSAKEASPYEVSLHKNIWNGNFNGSCGASIDLGTVSGKAFTVKIPLCISLRSFLPLSNIRYLPAFAGKIELRVYFSTEGMVYCPIGYNGFINRNKALYNSKLENITAEFKQIGDQTTFVKIYTAGTSGAAGTFTTDTVTCNVENYTITKAVSIVPNFGIDNNIYMALMSRYMNSALTFPTQTIAVFPCSSRLNNVSAKTTQTVTPRFVESIFMLFPYKTHHKTVYHNPRFDTFQLQCGGYGNVPSVPASTKNDPAFITLCKNAMNLNSNVTGLNEEVMRSLTTTVNSDQTLDIISSEDNSFFIGLPVEADNCFQQGMTSNTPITYELHITQASDNKYMNSEATPLMCFLVDSTFSIQVQANGAPPLVELGAYDITSPVTE